MKICRHCLDNTMSQSHNVTMSQCHNVTGLVSSYFSLLAESKRSQVEAGRDIELSLSCSPALMSSVIAAPLAGRQL